MFSRSLFVRLRGRVLCQDVVLAGEAERGEIAQMSSMSNSMSNIF